MAGQILATYTIDTEQGDIGLVYQAPEKSGVTQGKVVINNFSNDNVVLYLVGGPGREVVGGVLQWVGSGTPVTEKERRQRILFWGDLEKYERFVEDGLMFGDGDQIWVEGKEGISNLELWGDLDVGAARKEELKGKVLLGTATSAEKEELMLLSGGAYVIQTNTNNCSCG